MAGALSGLITRAKPTLNKVKSASKNVGDFAKESIQTNSTNTIQRTTIRETSTYDKTKAGFDSKRSEMLSGLAKKDNQSLIGIKKELTDIEALLTKQNIMFAKLLKKPMGGYGDSSSMGLDDLASFMPDKKGNTKVNLAKGGKPSLLGKAKGLLGKGANFAKGLISNPALAEGVGKLGSGALKLGSKALGPALAAYATFEGVSDISGGKKVGNIGNAIGDINNPLDAIFSAINPSTYMDIGRVIGENIEESTGIGDNISRLFDKKNNATDPVVIKKQTTAFEKSTEAVDKFSKTGVKALTGTSKEFVKTEKSLTLNNKELKKATDEIKDFKVEDFFKSIGDKISDTWNMLSKKAGAAIQVAKDTTNSAIQTTTEAIGETAAKGMAATGNQEAKEAVSTMERNTPIVNSKMSGSRKDLMKNTYDAFINAGYSEKQAKALTSEVGRENGFEEKNVFGSHTDAANSATNTGFFSWQGNRSEKLKERMSEKGLLDKSGQMSHTQESLNEMAKFAKEEMESGQYGGLGNFMENKDVDSETAAKQLGKGYIKWAYGQDKLRSGASFDWKKHDAKRAGYYQQLESMLGKQGAVGEATGTVEGGGLGGQGTIVPENLSNVNLKMKSGEATAGGKALSGTTDLAKLAQSKYGDDIKYFSAFNDAYHQKNSPESGHTKGLKFDMVLNDSKKAEEMKANIEQMARDVGVPVKVLNEYAHPSSKASGGHLDVGFKNKEDADKFSMLLAQKEQNLIEREQIVAAKEDKSAGIEKEYQGSVASMIDKTVATNSPAQPVVVNNVNNNTNNNVSSGSGDSTGIPLITKNPDSYVQNMNTSLLYHSMS